MTANIVERPRRRRLLRVGAAVLALTAAGAGAWAVASTRPGALAPWLPGETAFVPAEPQPPRGLRVQVMRLAPAVEEMSLTGTVVARYETPVAFRVGGKVLSREVEVGQGVRAGEVLMVLDPADYAVALAAREAALAAAEAQAAQAEAEEVRQVELLREGWVSQAAYDRVLAAAEGAREQVRAAEAEVALARNDLGYTELVAPTDGVVTEVAAEEGEVVAAGAPVLTLVRPGEVEAEVGIPEGQIAGLDGWDAMATLWSGGGPIPAALREMAPEADAVGRTHRARFSLDGLADLGATVTVHLRRETGAPVARLPATALFFRDDAPLVWTMAPSGDRVEAAPVTVVRLGSEEVLLGGLPEGARVVTLGAHRLDEALPVRVIELVDPAEEGAS